MALVRPGDVSCSCVLVWGWFQLQPRLDAAVIGLEIPSAHRELTPSGHTQGTKSSLALCELPLHRIFKKL